MKRTTPTGLLLAATALVLAGCSGTGVPVERVRGDAYQVTAQEHISAVVLVRGWLDIMDDSQTGLAGATVNEIVSAAGCAMDVQFGFNPDGSTHISGTNSDCSTFDHTIQFDGSGAGTWTRTDGSVANMVWTAPEANGPLLSQQVTENLWDGTVIAYVLELDLSQPSQPETWTGTVKRADGRSMAFKLERTSQFGAVDGEDKITLNLPDGATLAFAVPTVFNPPSLHYPKFQQGGVGAYSSPTGQSLAFTVKGADGRWDRWEFMAGGGLTGGFTLDEDFSGMGAVKKDGEVLGALQWLADGDGTLDLLLSDQVEISPSAAARDFQVDQWFSNAAAMGPAPMY